MNFEDKDTFADKNGTAKSLVARLVDFYKDYDYYDYQDTLEVGETDEDAIKQMASTLTNPKAAALLLVQLKELLKNADLSSAQKTELESIIAGGEKMKFEDKYVERLKETYPVGTRIVVDHMGYDPRPIPPGTKGTVRIVDDMGTVHCDFDNGRRLGLIPGEDFFHIEPGQKQEQTHKHKHRR